MTETPGMKPRWQLKPCLSARLCLTGCLVLAGCGAAEEGYQSGTSGSGTPPDAPASQSAEQLKAGQPRPVPASLEDIPAVPADEIHLTIEPESPARYHRVSRGESLSGIARQYRSSVEALQQLNGLDDPGFLEPGQLLRLP